ncbi:hypothetical protein BCR32DRAFT_326508, partial [Anaeromyces robustus]
MTKLIIDYASKNNITLDINGKDNNGVSPILYCTFNNNVEMARLIVDYANENYIILNI